MEALIIILELFVSNAVPLPLMFYRFWVNLLRAWQLAVVMGGRRNAVQK